MLALRWVYIPNISLYYTLPVFRAYLKGYKSS
jgi:hypothetical protein